MGPALCRWLERPERAPVPSALQRLVLPADCWASARLGENVGRGPSRGIATGLSARAPEGQSRGLGCSRQVGVGVIFQVSLWSMTGRPGRPGWPGQVRGGSGVGLGVGEEFLRVSQASWPGPPLRLHPAGSPLPRVKQHCPGRRELGPTRPRGACYPKLGASGLLPFPCGSVNSDLPVASFVPQAQP